MSIDPNILLTTPEGQAISIIFGACALYACRPAIGAAIRGIREAYRPESKTEPFKKIFGKS